MRSESNTPLRSGLFSKSAASSRANTPSRRDRSHSRTSSSRCLAGGIGGGGPSRYSKTTGTFPALAAALAAFSARVSTFVRRRIGDFAGLARFGDLKCRADTGPPAADAPPSPALSALEAQLYDEGKTLWSSLLTTGLHHSLVGAAIAGDGGLAAAM